MREYRWLSENTGIKSGNNNSKNREKENKEIVFRLSRNLIYGKNAHMNFEIKHNKKTKIQYNTIV